MSSGSSLDALLEILAAEEALFVELKECLQSERRAMDELDATALEEAVRTKEAISSEARLCERSRLSIARELAAALGLASERPSLEALCEALGPDGEALGGARARLRALVAAASELLEANAVFAGRSLSEVQTTLEVFARIAPAAPIYGRTGPEPQLRSPGRLLHRSA